MTDENGNRVSPRSWIVTRVVNKLLDWSIVALLGLIAALVFEPLGKRMVAIWNAPVVQAEERAQMLASMAQLSTTISGVAEDVRRLKQPDAVFEMSIYNTRPVKGFCVELEPCEIVVRLRRLFEYLDCTLVPGSVQWGFINPRADTFVPAQRVDPVSSRNIGVVWTDVNIILMTPSGLEPEAYFTFTAFYRGCPGAREEDKPISLSSPRDLFTIRAAE